MLTDIFAYRYAKRPIWDSFGETESRLLMQAFRMIEKLFPYWIDGKESPTAKAQWTRLHDTLSMELGVEQLSTRFYSYQTTWMGKPHTQSGFYTMDVVCKGFICAPYGGQLSADQFMKDRVSFIELAFRAKAEEIRQRNDELPAKIAEANMRTAFKSGHGIRLPGNPAEGLRAWNASLNADFQGAVDELNERLRRAGWPLSYHNGFVQVTTDELTEDEIALPFWGVVADPEWKNVDIDMKEAFDRRDSNDRDPAFYAARALESAIKIISDLKGWTHGSERGAHNYIDNLAAAKNGQFIKPWERDALKRFFTEIRNPFGHGPGSAEMPELTLVETTWAIETCMSWVKSLIQRI